MKNRGLLIAWVLLFVYNAALLAFHLGTEHWWWAGMNGLGMGISMFGMWKTVMEE
jgi:hypothetical protein